MYEDERGKEIFKKFEIAVSLLSCGIGGYLGKSQYDGTSIIGLILHTLWMIAGAYMAFGGVSLLLYAIASVMKDNWEKWSIVAVCVAVALVAFFIAPRYNG